MDRFALNQELVLDPAGLGYASLSDRDAATLLNVEDRPYIVPLNSLEVLLWGTQNDRLLILDTCRMAGPPAARNICIAFFAMLSREDAMLDLNNPLQVQLADDLVEITTLESTDRDELIALATRLRSRAQELGFPAIREGDVERARA